MPKPITKKRKSFSGGADVAIDAEGNQMFSTGDPRNELEIAKRRRPHSARADSVNPAAKPVVPIPAVAPRPKVRVGTTNVRGAMKHNKRRLLKGVPPDIVIINERVQLDEVGFIPNEGSNIGFSYEYFPLSGNSPKTPEEIVTAKIIFAKVFAPNSGFSLVNPKPPCDIDEYGVLREGLNNRLQRIRTQVRAGKRNEGLSIRVRALMEQGIKIKKLLDDMVLNVEECTNYEEDGHTGFGVSKISNIDDDQMRRIIRNFSFLVLQALNPNPDFDSKMAVDPVDLMNTLDNTDFTESDMNQYLKAYEEKNPIPRLIGIILSDTNAQKSLLQLMLEDEKKKFLQTIIDSLTLKLEGTPSVATFATFQATLEGDDSNSKIMSIIGWIVDEIKRYSHNAVKGTADAHAAASTEIALKARLAELEASQGVLKLQLAEAQTNVAAAAPPTEGGVSQTVHDALVAKGIDDVKKVEEELVKLQADLEKCRAEVVEASKYAIKTKDDVIVTQKMYNSLVDLLKVAEDEVVEATTKNGKLEEEKRDLEAQLTGLQAEAAALEALKNTTVDKKKFAELEGQIAELTFKADDCTDKIEKITELSAKLAGTEIEKDKAQAENAGLKQQLHESRAATVAAAGQSQALYSQIEALKAEIAALRAPVADITADISTELKDANDKIAANQLTIRAAEEDIFELKQKLQGEEAGAASTDILAKEAEISSLKETNAKLLEIKVALEGKLKGFEKADESEALAKQAEVLAEKEAELIALNAKLAELEGKLASKDVKTAGTHGMVAAAEERENALRERVRGLASAIKSGESAKVLGPYFANPVDDSAFQELVAAVMEKTSQSEIKSNSTDICYLNYFVIFFIRELFFTPTYTPGKVSVIPNPMLSSEKNQIIATIEGVEDPKALLDLIFSILKSDNLQITSPEAIEFLRRKTITTNLEKVYESKFPEFYKNVGKIQYSIPGSTNPLTPTAALGNKTSISYLTLFTQFLFIARKYLLDNKDQVAGCGSNKYINEGVTPQSIVNPLSVRDTATEQPSSAKSEIYVNPFKEAPAAPAAPAAPPPLSQEEAVKVDAAVARRATAMKKPIISRLVEGVEELPPLSSNAKTLRLLIIDASKTQKKGASAATQSDIALTGEETSFLDQATKSSIMNNFLIKWQKENNVYRTVAHIARGLNRPRIDPGVDEEAVYAKLLNNAVHNGYRLSIKETGIMRKFLLDLMKAYVLTYKIGNVPSIDIDGKVDAIYPEFNKVLNPELQGAGFPVSQKTSLFSTLKIDIQTLKTFVKT